MGSRIVSAVNALLRRRAAGNAVTDSEQLTMPSPTQKIKKSAIWKARPITSGRYVLVEYVKRGSMCPTTAPRRVPPALDNPTVRPHQPYGQSDGTVITACGRTTASSTPVPTKNPTSTPIYNPTPHLPRTDECSNSLYLQVLLPQHLRTHCETERNTDS